MKKILCFLALCCSPLAGLAAHAAPAPCTVSLPGAWSDFTPVWIGACRNGFAEGLGTATLNPMGQFFHGELVHGKPTFGVYDSKDGFYPTPAPANASPGDTANHARQAYTKAAAAARATARYYKRMGDEARSVDFNSMAERLDNEMDEQ